jgi:hypothetical protein
MKVDLRASKKKLKGNILAATKRIEELERLVKTQEQETGFMKPRLAQARRIFKSSYAYFCSRCLSLCTKRDLLKCGHYLCFHCQATDSPCILCNSKEKYGNLQSNHRHCKVELFLYSAKEVHFRAHTRTE